MKIRFLLACLCLSPIVGIAQEKITLTLEETILRARRYSYAAESARHQYRYAYWNYRSHKASLLPSLSFSLSPSLSRTIKEVTQNDGSISYQTTNDLNTNAALNLSQNIGLTGGVLSVSSTLRRYDNFDNAATYPYNSTPLSVGYTQSNLFGYNSLKWEKKTAPLQYEASKKTYIQTMESVSRNAASLFFNLASQQTAWQIAQDNYANADTLYRINQRRYELGIIPENEMLSLEISRFNAENDLTDSRSALDDAVISLRSYLGIHADIELEVILDETVPPLHINEQEVIDLAYQNSPEIVNFAITEIGNEQSLASARGNRGISARLSMNFGLNQKGADFAAAYRNPLDYQTVSLSLSIPILDWGVSKGRVKMAESSRERSRLQLEQSRIEFHTGIIKDVKDFNQQASKVTIAYKSRELALRRFAIEQRQYINGNITLLEYNDASTKKDNALRTFISELSRYWNYYYNIRALTGYDFEQNILITEDFKLLTQ